jgi:hypothetical protein
MSALEELGGNGLPFAIYVPGQATAGTADEFTGIVAPFSGRITKVEWIPKAAITANATNYFTLNIRNRGAGGAGSTIAWSRAYSATNSTAFVAETGTNGSPTNRRVAKGDNLTIERTVSNATGLAMPAGTVVIWLAAN